MVLTLELSPELEARLQTRARQQGMDAQRYALLLLQTLDGIFGTSDTAPHARIANAVELYHLRLVSLEVAAELAGVSQSAFIAELGKAGVSVLQYSAEEALQEAGIA